MCLIVQIEQIASYQKAKTMSLSVLFKILIKDYMNKKYRDQIVEGKF